VILMIVVLVDEPGFEVLVRPEVEMKMIDDVPARQVLVTEGDVRHAHGGQAGEAEQHPRSP
jgi:hypothetical protein